jgi:hypothetical protein
MGRVIGIVAIYAAMFLAWTAVGLFMLISPARFGNLVHDSYGLYPEIGRSVWPGRLKVQEISGDIVARTIVFPSSAFVA